MRSIARHPGVNGNGNGKSNGSNRDYGAVARAVAGGDGKR
jgi:hypothetical protein